MNIAIVSNFAGIGLQTDFNLLRDYLTVRGHEVTGYQYDEAPKALPKYDLAIFLESIPRVYLGLAETKFWFPNIEWVKDNDLDLARKYFAKVFAKTHETQLILEPLIPGKVFRTGFLTRDQNVGTIQREGRWLHIGGNSQIRGTQAVYDAFANWKRNGKSLDAQLTIVSTMLKVDNPPSNVTILDRVSEEELKRLQNSHFFHIYPSGTEGWGHAIHEALSVNACLVTTEAPPMWEFSQYQIPVSGKSRYNLADVYEVSALDVYETVQSIMRVKPFGYSRARFEKDNAEFAAAFDRHLEELVSIPWVDDHWEVPKDAPPSLRRKVEGRKCIAFVGNFAAPESTENQILWALTERLGYDVEKLQENETNLSAIQNATN